MDRNKSLMIPLVLMQLFGEVCKQTCVCVCVCVGHPLCPAQIY